jgi:3-oxoacid CoA-transferase subunit A
MKKLIESADAAVADIPDGAMVAVGGFGLCGVPENLLNALVRKGSKHLTVITNTCGTDDKGVGMLIASGQVDHVIASYVGENAVVERLYAEGKLTYDLMPQGSIAEGLRCAGHGLPAFFTPAGVGTVRAEGREVRMFDGREFLMEYALKPDFSLVKAYRGDAYGNLRFRYTARNFNPLMAMAAKTSIAEVEIVEHVGDIHPDDVHLAGIYVDRVVKGDHYQKPIERLTTRPRQA